MSGKNRRGDRRRDGRGSMARMHYPKGHSNGNHDKGGPTSSNRLKDIESLSSFDVLELEKFKGWIPKSLRTWR